MASPQWIGERLQAEGLVTASQYAAALRAMQVHEERMEEALIRVGALDELRLLQFVAEKTRTRYLSTAHLARLEVAEEALRVVPERVAEMLLVFPVRFEKKNGELVVVSPDAGIPEHVKQIRVATGVRALRAYIARPLAVKAAIRKWYRGEIQAFAGIAPETFAQLEAQDRFQAAPPLATGASAPPVQPSAPPLRTSDGPSLGQPSSAMRPNDSPRAAPITVTAQAPAITEMASQGVLAGGPDRRIADLAELLHVLVALNENAREEFRGHSGSVARFARDLVKRTGHDEMAAMQVAMAANLHDLGKPLAYHLTLLNTALYPTHRSAAQKLVYTPLRLLESIELPEGPKRAVGSMYERFDGQGLPKGLRGRQIPAGARILALCDTFSDLTLNPSNPCRRVLPPTEACQVLVEHKSTLFDPDLVDLLANSIRGEDLRRRLGDHSPRVLLVEPEPEEATILELRLVAQGFHVEIARTASQALDTAARSRVDFVLSELDLEPFDGFELLQRLRKTPAGATVPFFFVARTSDTANIERAFAAGASDYVVKPTSGDVLAAKLRRLASATSPARPAQGIAGSLGQMGLPDLAQILEHGRKSGRLKLENADRRGEVHFEAGRVVHARIADLEGEPAFFELLSMSDGSFELDPSFVPTKKTIQAGTESLLLEGLRRLDERQRGAGQPGPSCP